MLFTSARVRSLSRLAQPVSIALLAFAFALGCDSYRRDPTYLLRGGLDGRWRLDRKSGHVPDVPEGLEVFSVSILEQSDVHMGYTSGMSGVLVNSQGHEYPFELNTDYAGLYGPWVVLQEGSTRCGWNDRVWLGVLAREDRRDDTLLVAFGPSEDGAIYPHEYSREGR